MFIFCYVNDSLYTLISISLMKYNRLLMIVIELPKPIVVTLTVHLSKCARICSRDLCVYLGRLSLKINIPMVIYFAYGAVQLAFDCFTQYFKIIQGLR